MVSFEIVDDVVSSYMANNHDGSFTAAELLRQRMKTAEGKLDESDCNC
jgi:hypothetical protein